MILLQPLPAFLAIALSVARDSSTEPTLKPCGTMIDPAFLGLLKSPTRTQRHHPNCLSRCRHPPVGFLLHLNLSTHRLLLLDS